MEPRQRQDAAALGVDQEDACVLSRIGHGEDAPGIAVEQVAGVEGGHDPGLARAPAAGE